MAGRGQPRLKCVLPVRIVGTDRDGQRFEQLSCTLDISSRGARISGIRVHLHLGASVIVHYKNRRAPFRVAWIGTPGSRTRNQIGVTTANPRVQFWTGAPEVPQYVDDYVAVEAREQQKVWASRPKDAALALAVSPEEEVTKRLREMKEELREVATLLERGIPDAATLQQFRDALSYVRDTSWILQEWLELRQKPETRFPLVTMLNNERLRIAIVICNELATFLTSVKVELEPVLMSQFIAAVQQLFLIISAAEENKPSTTAKN